MELSLIISQTTDVNTCLCSVLPSKTLSHISQRPVAAAAKSLQSCLTLRDPVDGSPPGSSVHGILLERILEWVAISFSSENCSICWGVRVTFSQRLHLLSTYVLLPRAGICGGGEGHMDITGRSPSATCQLCRVLRLLICRVGKTAMAMLIIKVVLLIMSK